MAELAWVKVVLTYFKRPTTSTASRQGHSPMTELTFLEVFLPKAQMQADSAGTVKLAKLHWESTYWPIMGPTFPTRANLRESRRKNGIKVLRMSIFHIPIYSTILPAPLPATYAERRFNRVSFKAKIWTVPLSLDAQRNEESWLKLMLWGRKTFHLTIQGFFLWLCFYNNKCLIFGNLYITPEEEPGEISLDWATSFQK